jgi:basic membrane protein A
MRDFAKYSTRYVSTTCVLLLVLVGFTTQASAEFKVALILDRGGKDDKSFNTSAFEGANRAKEKLGITLKFVEAADDNAYESILRSFARREFDLMIGVGFAQKEAVQKVAAQFPKKHFAIVDSEIQAPNVRSLMFEEHEGAFLVGAIAAMASKGKPIGFVGGMDIPLIRRFAVGYEAGAKQINPAVKVIVNFVGITGEAWNNSPKAKELALSQYDNGAEVVFAAAGASNFGVFDAAEERKRLAIGVDSNQNWTKPGFILTSMLKRVDEAVYATIEEAQSGKFQGGIRKFGLANQGIGYAVDKFNEKLLTSEMRVRAEELKRDILSGKIEVPDFYKTR